MDLSIGHHVLLELVPPVVEASGEGIPVAQGGPHGIQILDHGLFHLNDYIENDWWIIKNES